MKYTKLDNKSNKYYIETKSTECSNLGSRIYGEAALKLAMYENIAATPMEFAQTIKAAQEMLEGVAFTPKQAERINTAVAAQVEKASEAVFSAITDKLTRNGYEDAAKFLDAHIGDTDAEEAKQ